jgi:hypothetical protein
MDVAALSSPAVVGIPAVVSGKNLRAAPIHLELAWFSGSATKVAKHRKAS